MSASHLVVTRWGARLGGRAMPCSIGWGGVARKESEGDGRTPIGTWRLCAVYYRPERVAPPCAGAQAIGLREAWCDDPRDARYNSVMLQSDPARERLRRADPLYDLVGVLDFNRDPVRAGAGSAIFLHLWRKPLHPTAGCVGFARRDLVWVLGRLGVGGTVVIR